MRGLRTMAGAVVLMGFIGLAATGQQDGTTSKAKPQAPGNCQVAMPVILKQYNNAKYAVQRAGYSADAAHILGPVREAQAALDAMEQPLKICAEALENGKSNPPGSKD